MVKHRTYFNSKKGLSLTELLTVMAIVGLLATISYPSYTKYTRESRRSEAHSHLFKIQTYMEQYYIRNNTYDTQVPTNLASTDNYTYTNSNKVATAYTIKATATNLQLKDTTCLEILLTHTGDRSPGSCW